MIRTCRDLVAVATSALICCAAIGCGGEREDVLSAHDANEGTIRVFDGRVDQVWAASRAALRWNHADAIEEHRPEGYMLATAGISGFSWGASMGVWVEPANRRGTRVRVIVSRKLVTNIAGQSEDMLLDDITTALAFVKSGEPIPEDDPE